MWRWLMILAWLVVAAVVLLPGAVGWATAAEFKRWLAANTDRAELFELKRGWFASRGSVLVRATGPGGVPLELPVTFHYGHGPLVWQAGPRFGWLQGAAEIAAAELTEQWQFERDRPLWRGEFTVGYGLRLALSDSAQAFVYAEQLAADRWQGGGTASLGGEFDYRGELMGLRLIDASGPLVLSGLTLQLQRPAGAGATEAALGLKGIQLGGAGDALRAETAQLTGVWQPRPEAGGGALALTGSAASLVITGELYRDAALELSLEPVPAAFAARLRATLQAIYLGQPALTALGELLAGVRQELVPAGPDLRLQRLAFTAPAGAFSLAGAASLPPAPAAPAHWLAVLPQLNLEVSATAAKPLALQWAAGRAALSEQEALFNAGRAIDPAAIDEGAEARARTQLATWVAAGWLREEGDSYRLSAAWRGGQLQLNGQPMGLPF